MCATESNFLANSPTEQVETVLVERRCIVEAFSTTRRRRYFDTIVTTTHSGDMATDVLHSTRYWHKGSGRRATTLFFFSSSLTRCALRYPYEMVASTGINHAVQRPATHEHRAAIHHANGDATS